MAKTFWEIAAVEVSREAGESTCTFCVVLDGPPGVFRLEDVPADVILSYERLQCHILRRLGIRWSHTAVDGRGPEAAGIMWGHVLDAVLVPARPPLPADATLNCLRGRFTPRPSASRPFPSPTAQSAAPPHPAP